MDLEYIDHWSLALDFRFCSAPFRAVLPRLRREIVPALIELAKLEGER